MKSIGEQLDVFPVGGDGGTIVHVSQVAHVTFYITSEDDRWFHLFSESEKRGIEEAWQSPYSCYEYATGALAHEQANLEETLERKRKGMPTQKQVYFFFRNEIPIPPDLTWGQASDIIDEKMAQFDKEKQAKIQETAARFKGLWVGKHITCQFVHPLRTISGEVTKLTSYQGKPRYAYIRFDGEKYESRFFIEALPKIVQDESPELVKT